MRSAVAIRHVSFEGLGVFEEVLRESGIGVSSCDVGEHNLDLLESTKTGLMVFLG